LPSSLGKGTVGLAAITTLLPSSLGKGTVGLAAITTLLPSSLGKGTVGLAAITTLLPSSLGKGTVGLAAITKLLPSSLGKGTVGLLDTIALAKHGTVSTADRTRTEKDFMAGASQGSSNSWRIAYALRTLAEVAQHRYNFGGI
jgi:hypothetical protein